MGRRRESNFDDPPRFHKKGKTWYHVSGAKPRVWRKLSSDRAEALRLWAKLEGVKEDDAGRTLTVIARRYVREVYPKRPFARDKLPRCEQTGKRRFSLTSSTRLASGATQRHRTHAKAAKAFGKRVATAT